MLFSLLADLVVVLHFAFILFVIGGAVLVYFWRRVIWLHVPCALWGAWIEFSGWICPLTPLENWLRQRANETGYSENFIEHYLVPVIYPSGLTSEVQIALGLFVVCVNVGMYWWIARRWRGKQSAHLKKSSSEAGMVSETILERLTRLEKQIASYKRSRFIWYFIGALILISCAAVFLYAATSLKQQSSPADWVNALAQCGLVIAAVLGGWLIGRDVRKLQLVREEQQKNEAEARANLALNVTVKARVYKTKKFYFVETLVDVTNPSRKEWCLPLTYINIRGGMSDEIMNPFSAKVSFSEFIRCDEITEICNVAYLPASVMFLDPDEKVTLARYDKIEVDFANKYPVLVINVEVFGTSVAYLKEKPNEKNRGGEMRLKWINHMNQLKTEINPYMIIGRLSPAEPSPLDRFRPGARCIVKRDINGKIRPDQELSDYYRELLEEMLQFTVPASIHLTGNSQESGTNG